MHEGIEQVKKHRVITMLNRDEMEFLDKVGKDALFSTGHKLSYNDILKSLIDFAMEMGLSGENVSSLESLKERLHSDFPRYMQHLKEEKERGK